jgi:peptide/nickel transport system ATP-binding protein
MTPAAAKPVLLSTHLSVRYGDRPAVLRDVELEILHGEVQGLVGQSGSGKSTLAMAILGLLGKRAQAEGTIRFENRDLLTLSESELRAIRGRELALVLQSPLSSLNPALKIRTQLKEAWRAHDWGGRPEAEAAIQDALESVSLPSHAEFLRKYPSQMSVGQAQRVLIAMAILHRPALLIADEATSALDVITQSEILGLFAKLNRERGMSILYISHDLASVAGICHRISILHEGTIVECAPAEQIFTRPQHQYTQRLIAAMPRPPAVDLAARAAAGSSTGAL